MPAQRVFATWFVSVATMIYIMTGLRRLAFHPSTLSMIAPQLAPSNLTSCNPHVVFTTFACSDRPNCSRLRQRIENNTRKVWSSMDEVEFIDMTTLPSVGKNQFGMPLLRDMYVVAMGLCPDARTYTYLNGDIIGSYDGFVKTLESLFPGYNKLGGFLLVGRRTNVPWSEASFHDCSSSDFDFQALAAAGAVGRPDAEDYFTLTRETFDWKNMLPFVIGRPGYDNWLVQTAHYDPSIQLVDVTATAQMIHQTDEAGTKSWGRGEGAREQSAEDTRYNMDLLPRRQQFPVGKIWNAQWETFSENGTIHVRHKYGWGIVW